MPRRKPKSDNSEQGEIGEWSRLAMWYGLVKRLAVPVVGFPPAPAPINTSGNDWVTEAKLCASSCRNSRRNATVYQHEISKWQLKYTSRLCRTNSE